MIDREKTISGLKEIADYFHECRGNASFGSKAEEHFWELQSAARDAVEMFYDGAFVMTDEAAIEQLRSSGWMQNHDREMSRPCWISVKDRMPESGKPVLVTCEIHSLYGYKKQYVCEAYHAEAHSVSEGKYPEDTDCYDYCEKDDEYYLKEGWYEVIHNWDEYGSIVIGDFVTHWMPLPEPPKEEENNA